MKYLARKRCTRLSQIAILDKSHSGWSGAPRPYLRHFHVRVSSIPLKDGGRVHQLLHRGRGRHLRGDRPARRRPQAAGELIRYVHETAFDARPELKNLLVDTGKAAIEADFAGTHTGEFAGIQPTGRAVRVPYSVIYDLRDDQISALRIYFPMSLLIEQLTS